MYFFAKHNKLVILQAFNPFFLHQLLYFSNSFILTSQFFNIWSQYVTFDYILGHIVLICQLFWSYFLNFFCFFVKIISRGSQIMKNLRILRETNRLTQREFAEKLNIAKTTLCYYEQGKISPSIDTLNKIADFFGCSVDYLVGHETQSILHLDSFTPAQQNIINQIKDLDDHELAILEGFLFRLQQEKANPWLNKK